MSVADLAATAEHLLVREQSRTVGAIAGGARTAQAARAHVASALAADQLVTVMQGEAPGVGTAEESSTLSHAADG